MSYPGITEEPVDDRKKNGLRELVSSRPLMTPEQCAAFLQIEVNTLYVMKYQGRIPYRKVGNRLRFDLTEIIEWTKGKGK